MKSSKTTAPSLLLQLPEEIVLKIFYLLSQLDVLKLRQTNSHFNSTFLKHYKYVVAAISHSKNTRLQSFKLFLQGAGQTIGKLVLYGMKGYDVELISLMTDRCDNLENLYLKDCKVTMVGLSKMLTMKRVKWIETADTKVAPEVEGELAPEKAVSNVERLTVNDVYPDIIGTVVKTDMPSLQFLKMGAMGLTHFKYSTQLKHVTSFKKLETLELSGTDEASLRQLVRALSVNENQLSSLVIIRLDPPRPEEQEQELPELTAVEARHLNLTKLQIFYGPEDNLMTVKIPELLLLRDTLTVMYMPSLTARECDILSSCKSLNKLELGTLMDTNAKLTDNQSIKTFRASKVTSLRQFLDCCPEQVERAIISEPVDSSESTVPPRRKKLCNLKILTVSTKSWPEGLDLVDYTPSLTKLTVSNFLLASEVVGLERVLNQRLTVDSLSITSSTEEHYQVNELRYNPNVKQLSLGKNCGDIDTLICVQAAFPNAQVGLAFWRLVSDYQFKQHQLRSTAEKKLYVVKVIAERVKGIPAGEVDEVVRKVVNRLEEQMSTFFNMNELIARASRSFKK